MADYVVSDTNLTAVANAIRTKGGTSAQLSFPTGFTDAIAAIPTGGGGASNVVTGTFKGTTTGAAMDVDIPYTGNGYPIAILIFPTEGPYNSQSGSFYSLVQRYAAAYYTAIKSRATSSPVYNAGGNDGASISLRYKNGTSNATSYASSASDGGGAFYDAAATGTSSGLVRIRSNKKMSVFIAGSSYGFAANIEYTYYVIYSS